MPPKSNQPSDQPNQSNQPRRFSKFNSNQRRNRPPERFPRTLVLRKNDTPVQTGTLTPPSQAPRPNNRPRPAGMQPRRGRPNPQAKRRALDRIKKAPFTHTHKGANSLSIPQVEPGVLRVIPIGGVEQVGQNMTALEYGDDIIIVDAGFQFSTDDTPGVDYIIPNIEYLEKKKEKIRGLFITHGHLDHVGAIPYVIEKLGNPPIYTREFGSMIILKRQEEFPHVPKLNIKLVGKDDVIDAGNFRVRNFSISHTIPDSMGLLIETPLGEVVFIEDVRVDNDKGIVTEEEDEQYARFKDKQVLLLTLDSTGIEKPGWSLSEMTVVKNIEAIMQKTPSRLFIATFASQIERIVEIIAIAERLGKKLLVDGRSMKTNVEIAKALGLIKAKNIISIDEINDYPPNKIVMLVTGAQGEEFAVLNRISNRTHKQIQLTNSDTILLSSSVVPVNWNDVVKLKDNLYRSGAKIITYLDSDVHASGHGSREELRWIHNHINYKFFVPVHGNYYMTYQHAELAGTLGAAKENIIVPENGSIIEIYNPEGMPDPSFRNGIGLEKLKIRVRKEKAPSEVVTVDGLAIGDTQEFVIRDRKMLAQDGMFVVVVVVDGSTGKLKKSPDLISRGFVYLKDNQELLRETRSLIKRTVEGNTGGGASMDYDFIKEAITDAVERFLFQRTAKHPLIIPVILSL